MNRALQWPRVAENISAWCKLTRSIDEMMHCANSSFHLMMVVYNMRGFAAVIFSDYIKPIN